MFNQFSPMGQKMQRIMVCVRNEKCLRFVTVLRISFVGSIVSLYQYSKTLLNVQRYGDSIPLLRIFVIDVDNYIPINIHDSVWSILNHQLYIILVHSCLYPHFPLPPYMHLWKINLALGPVHNLSMSWTESYLFSTHSSFDLLTRPLKKKPKVWTLISQITALSDCWRPSTNLSKHCRLYWCNTYAIFCPRSGSTQIRAHNPTFFTCLSACVFARWSRMYFSINTFDLSFTCLPHCPGVHVNKRLSSNLWTLWDTSRIGLSNHITSFEIYETYQFHLTAYKCNFSNKA